MFIENEGKNSKQNSIVFLQIIMKLKETVAEKTDRIAELEIQLQQKEEMIVQLKKNRSRPPSFCDT